MLQRKIVKALQIGLSAYRENENLYTKLFADIYDLTAHEVAKIAEYFRKNPVVIKHGYPRTAMDKMPHIYVFLQSESQPDMAVGDYGGAAGASSSGSGQAGGGTGGGAGSGTGVLGPNLLSSMWQHNYTLLITGSDQPEICMYLAEITKASLLAAKAYFLKSAMDRFVLSGGDVQPPEQYATDLFFMRSMNVRFYREFSMADSDGELQRYYKVAGLLLESGSPNAPLGPLTLAKVGLR